MAKKTKKTAARRKSARKPARRRVVKVIRGVATLGARVVPAFDNLDPVRILNGGAVGVVVGVLNHYRGDPDYNVRFRGEDGLKGTKYFAPGELAHA